MNKRILSSVAFAALAGLAVIIAIFLCQPDTGTGTGESPSSSPAHLAGAILERGSNAPAGRSSTLTRRITEPEDDEQGRQPQSVASLPAAPAPLFPNRPTLYRIDVQTNAGQTGSSTARPGGIELEVPQAVRKPIALSVPTEGLTPAQATVLEAMSDGFGDRLVQAVEKGLGGTSPMLLLTTEGEVSRFVIRKNNPDEGLGEVWRQEQEDADSIYRKIFGDAAYQRRHIETATRALGLISAQAGGEAPPASGR